METPRSRSCTPSSDRDRGLTSGSFCCRGVKEVAFLSGSGQFSLRRLRLYLAAPRAGHPLVEERGGSSCLHAGTDAVWTEQKRKLPWGRGQGALGQLTRWRAESAACAGPMRGDQAPGRATGGPSRACTMVDICRMPLPEGRRERKPRHQVSWEGLIWTGGQGQEIRRTPWPNTCQCGRNRA